MSSDVEKNNNPLASKTDAELDKLEEDYQKLLEVPANVTM